MIHRTSILDALPMNHERLIFIFTPKIFHNSILKLESYYFQIDISNLIWVKKAPS